MSSDVGLIPTLHFAHLSEKFLQYLRVADVINKFSEIKTSDWMFNGTGPGSGYRWL